MGNMYHCCPHHSRQIQNSTGEYIAVRVEEASVIAGGSESPVEDAGQGPKEDVNRADCPGALNVQQMTQAGRCHQQDHTWNLAQEKMQQFLVILARTLCKIYQISPM